MNRYQNELVEYQKNKPQEFPLHGTIYQKMIWFFTSKTFITWGIAALIVIFKLVTTGVLLIFTYYRRPPPPLLPDLIHEAIPFIPAISVVNFMIVIGMITLFTFLLWPPKLRHLSILKRSFLIYSYSMLLRDITMTLTSLPDPSPLCPKDWDSTPEVTFKKVLGNLFGGLTCGDLIFSGHTLGLLLPTLIIQRYFGGWIVKVMWANTLLGSILVILSRLHYGVDVALTFFVVPTIWFMYNTIADHPDTYEDELNPWVKWYFEKMEWCDPIPSINNNNNRRHQDNNNIV